MDDRSTMSVTRDAKAYEGSVENSVAVVGSIRPVHRLSGIASMRHNLRLTGYGVWLAGVYLLLGYEIVFIGSIAALPAFLLEFGTFYGRIPIIPSVWLSLWAASGPIGTMIGSVFGGWLQDALGRRRSLLWSSIFQIGTIFMCYFADEVSSADGRRALYFAGKLVQGIAMGAIICTAQTYISEVFSPQLRGPLLSLPPIFTLLGEFIGALIIKSRVSMLERASYRIPLACQWVFSAVPLFLAVVLPESPVWLMRRRQWDLASRACKRLEGPPKDNNVLGTYDRLKTDLEQEGVENGERLESSYVDCFKRAVNARRTGIVIFANLIPILFGLPMLGHSTYLATLVGMDASDAYDFFIGGCVMGLVANMTAVWAVTRFGRRTLLLSTMAAMAILWLSVGIAACFKTTSIAWYLATALILVTGFASVGAWPVSYIVAGEVSELSLRAKSQGVGWFANGLGTGVFAIVLPYMYNPGSGDLRGKIGFVFFGFATLGLIISWLVVPEMKDRPPAEVDRMFEIGLSARKFRDFRMEQHNTAAEH